MYSHMQILCHFTLGTSAPLTSESNFGIHGGPETNPTTKDAAEGQL